MRKLFYIFCFLILTVQTQAQSITERVLILNEGYYDYWTGDIITPVSIGSYNPELDSYTKLHEIEGARFASDIVLDENFYYVAADHLLLKYDLLSDALIHSIEVVGIRKIAVNENYLVITRGEYLVALDAYIQVYDKEDLSLVFEVSNTTLNYTTEGVVIQDDYAFVAVNNGFDFGNEVGKIAKINLSTNAFVGTIDLGIDGKNPDNLMMDGDLIYTLNNKNYTGSSVSVYNISTDEVSTNNLINISSGCGTSILIDDNIYYQELFANKISKYEPLSETFIGDKNFGKSFYGLGFDEVNQILYASETDYFSFGKVYLFDLEGNEIGQFDADISPGTIAFDVKTVTGISFDEMEEMQVSPNPTTSILNVYMHEQIISYQVFDMLGNIVLQNPSMNNNNFTIDCSDLSSGNYFISMISEKGILQSQFIKN